MDTTTMIVPPTSSNMDRNNRSGPGTIPSELLSEIFLHCVDGDGGMDELNTIHVPLLVSQICTRWRRTALATPRLWSRLYLELDLRTDGAITSNDNIPLASDSWQVLMVREWLDRSGACPLTVYLSWVDAPFLPSHPVLDALMTHSERWQTMFLYLPYSAFKPLSRVRKHLPLLRSLSLGTSDDPSSSGKKFGFTGKLDAFSNAPRLRSLECVNCSPLIFKFPWSQLTTIPMMAVSIDDCIDVLLQTSRLEKAGFIFIEGFPSVYGRAIRHQHDRIRSFTIMTPSTNETVDLRGLFPQLCFPRLEELLICNLRSPFCAEFVMFLSRLRCLRTLHLRKTALLDYQLVQGLRYLPTLTSLIVYSAPYQAPTVTHSLLASLTWERGQQLLPLLTKLELTIDYNVSEDFITMVLSRILVRDGVNDTDHPARLEQIRIRPTEDLGDRIYTGLAKIASHGVEISVEDFQ